MIDVSKLDLTEEQQDRLMETVMNKYKSLTKNLQSEVTFVDRLSSALAMQALVDSLTVEELKEKTHERPY